MRILFVTPYYKPYFGGIERVIEKLAHHYIQKGHEVGVLTSKWIFPNTPREKRYYRTDLAREEKLSEGVTVYRVRSFPHTAPPMYQVPLVYYPPSEFKEIITKFQPDVIQLMSDRWFWGNFFSWLYKKSARVVFSLSFHELEWSAKSNPLLWVVKQLLRPINAFLTRVADWVQVISEHEKKLVHQTYWTPLTQMKKMWWGVDPIKARQRDWSNKKSILTIICVGRLSEHKGQEWLCETVYELAEHSTKKLRIILIGKDDGLGRQLEEKFTKTKNFELDVRGEVSDEQLHEAYEESDVFALFSEYEAFGIVYIEAMQHHIPVVTQKVGAVEEVIQKGGLLIDPYNKGQAKVVLSRLLEDDAFREALSNEAKEYSKEFSWEKTAEKFLEEYKQIN